MDQRGPLPLQADPDSRPGQDPREVVIGVSPSVGRDVWRCLSGLTVPEVVAELLAGLEEEGCTCRVILLFRANKYRHAFTV